MLTVKSIAGDERLAGEFGTHTHTQTQLPVLAVRLDRGNFPLSHQPGEFGDRGPAGSDPEDNRPRYRTQNADLDGAKRGPSQTLEPAHFSTASPHWTAEEKQSERKGKLPAGAFSCFTVFCCPQHLWYWSWTVFIIRKIPLLCSAIETAGGVAKQQFKGELSLHFPFPFPLKVGIHRTFLYQSALPPFSKYSLQYFVQINV